MFSYQENQEKVTQERTWLLASLELILFSRIVRGKGAIWEVSQLAWVTWPHLELLGCSHFHLAPSQGESQGNPQVGHSLQGLRDRTCANNELIPDTTMGTDPPQGVFWLPAVSRQ